MEHTKFCLFRDSSAISPASGSEGRYGLDMSRFVLDCALRRPVADTTAQWHVAALQKGWAGPAAGYHEGRISRALLEQSAATMAGLLGARSAWFSPALTAAVHAAVGDLLSAGSYEGLATSQTDPLVLQDSLLSAAGQAGLPGAVLPVDGAGRIDRAALKALPTPAIVATGAANQEIGTLQADLTSWAAGTGSAVILDASCALGWVDPPTGWSRLLLDARAWGSVPGAVTVISTGPAPVVDFDNVPAAVVAGLATERWLADSHDAAQTARAQVAFIIREVASRLAGVEIRGGGPDDLPHILSISVLYVDAEVVQGRLDTRGYAVGSGSACASRSGQPSHVLSAIGGLTSGNVRIGLPPGLDDEVVSGFVDALVEVVQQVRSEMGTLDL